MAAAGSAAEPLLGSSGSFGGGARAPSAVAAALHSFFARLGIESSAEGRDVMWLASQAFLANSVFVLGRNLGPVLFMHSCGAEELTGALFLSGAAIIGVSPLYG